MFWFVCIAVFLGDVCVLRELLEVSLIERDVFGQSACVREREPEMSFNSFEDRTMYIHILHL